MPRRNKSPGTIDSLLDRDALRLLLTLSQAHSFAAAAAELHISQAAVSQQVRRLEHIAGRTLFRRSRKGLELTGEGETVIAYARAVSELTHDLRKQLAGTSSLQTISLGMSEDFCRSALPSILQLFLRQHPHIDVRVISGTYKTITEAIEARAVDLAVMRRYGAFPNTVVLWRDQLAWNGRLQTPLPIEDPVPLVVPIAPNPAREVLIETLRAAGRTWRIRFESVGLAGVEAALSAGLGVCAGPRRMQLIGAGPLAEGHGLPALPHVEFVMVGPDPARTDPMLRAFAQVMRRAIASGSQIQP